MFVASAISCSFGGFGGRILSFISGPCTIGPGMVIKESLKEHFWTFDDIENNSESIYLF